MKKLKKISIFLGFLAVFSLLASPVLAAEFKTGTDKSGNVTVNEDEEFGNLYTAGNMVSINGIVNDDLIGIGNTVLVKKDIGDDLWIAGGTVTVQGDIGGSLRSAGGNLIIDGDVEKDILVAGGNITLSNSSEVSGDVLLAGGVIQIDSTVEGDLKVVGGQVTLNGKVEGDVKVTADEKLVVTDNARIDGDLIYKSPREADIAEGAVIGGETDFTKKEVRGVAATGFWGGLEDLFSLKTLARILVMTVAGLVLIYLFRKIFKVLVKEGTSHYWKSLGLGFASLILVPVAFLMLMLTFVGVWLGGLLILLHVFVLMVSIILASIILGSWIVKNLKKAEKYRLDWLAVITGVVAINIIAAIPFVGWLASLILVMLALGAIYGSAFKYIWLK